MLSYTFGSRKLAIVQVMEHTRYEWKRREIVSRATTLKLGQCIKLRIACWYYVMANGLCELSSASDQRVTEIGL